MSCWSLRRFAFWGMAVVVFTTGQNPAWAQVPSTAEPSRIAPREETLPQRLESVEPKTDDTPRAAFQLTEDDAKRIYRMDALVIDGMTAYSQESVQKQYRENFGKKITLAEIFVIAAKLQQRYLDDGYTLTKVEVPPQQNGTIRLKVIEGYVAEVETKGVQKDDRIVIDLIRRLKAMRL